MNAQEQQMIQSLADRINNTPLNEKDPDAEQFLQQALGRNPDALYILAQTTLVQQYALEQAQKQLADMRAQVEQAQKPKHTTSFLGNLLGRNDEPTAPPPPPYTPVPDYNQPGRPYPQGGSSFSGPGYAPPPPPYGQPQYGQPQYGQPQYGQPQYGQPQYGPPQSGGFLRSAMQTATGVAAGALAFEGIESLMHGFGGSSGGGRPEEIVNNYYGDDAGGEHRGLSSDIEDRRDERSSFDDAVDRNDHNYGKDDLLDTSGSDDSGNNADDTDTGSDDSSFDDGGSSDDFSSSDDSSNS